MAEIKDFWTCGIFLSKEPFKELVIKCFMCDSLYSNIQEFQKHLANEHSEEETDKTNEPVSTQINNDPYFGACETESLELLNNIVDSLNTDEKEQKDEELYDKYFTARLEYPIAESILEPIEHVNKDIMCKHCDKPFKDSVQLKRHRNQEHINCSCTFCFRKFNNRVSMTKHEQSRDNTFGLMCDKCGLKFKERHLLQGHMRISHEKLRPFLCSKCPKTYARRTHLNDHMRSHSPRRDYTCEQCFKAFRRSQDLTRHKLVHQAEKSYSCKRCEATFRQHSGLYNHMKNKHGSANKKVG